MIVIEYSVHQASTLRWKQEIMMLQFDVLLLFHTVIHQCCQYFWIFQNHLKSMLQPPTVIPCFEESAENEAPTCHWRSIAQGYTCSCRSTFKVHLDCFCTPAVASFSLCIHGGSSTHFQLNKWRTPLGGCWIGWCACDVGFQQAKRSSK